MEQVLRVTPVVGLPQFNGWSHVWELALDPQTKCVICLSIVGDNAGNIGRDVTEAIAQLPPRSAQGLYQIFEDCIQLTTDQRGELSIAGGIFRNKRSIFATYKSSIILKRDSKVGRIIQSDSELQVIEGRFDTDDVFVFSTDTARQFLSQIELSFQRGYDSDGVITAIVPALHSLEDSSTSALAFIAITEQDTSEPVYVPPAMEIDFQTTTNTETPVLSVEHEQAVATDTLESSSGITIGSSEELVGQPDKPSSATSVAKVTKNMAKLGRKTIEISKKLGTNLINFKRLFSSKTYVGLPSSKKVTRWLIVIVGVVIIVGVVVWIVRSRMQQAEAVALETAAPFRSQLSEVVSAAESDPIPARETVAALIESIKNAQSEAEVEGEKRTVQELAAVFSEAQAVYQEISGRDEVSELPLFYDLRLVTSDFISSLATSSDNLSVFIDDEKKEALILNLQTKQVFKLDLSSLAPIRSIGAFQTSQIVVLANGVYTLDLKEGATPVVVKEEGDSNREGTLTASFGSFVYVFNPDKRNIYRYVQEGDTYSDPVGWLLDPLGVPFESVVSWAIDGDIWIGTEGGQVLRFASGKTTDFTIAGLPESFVSSIQVVTRENLENVYILEPAQNRLVVLTKEGQFLREIKSSSLGAATSLLIDQTGSKAFAVSGSSVFEVDV